MTKKRLPPNHCSCRICGQPTPMLGTQLCDPCWHLDRNIGRATIPYLKEILQRRGYSIVSNEGTVTHPEVVS